MKGIIQFILIVALISPAALFASKFEELDKPPEGAHKGQMFLGAYVSMGYPFGDIFNSEQDFVDNTIYEFTESGIYKELWISHLAFTFGLSFEYMPMDYIGVKSKLRRMVVVQRTMFGSEFRNWSEAIYEEYSLLLGPSFHLTNRKQWDVTFTPVVGYALATFHPTPVVAELKDDDYSGLESKTVNNITTGAELNFTAYFSGGLFISLGFDWIMTFMNFGSAYDVNYTDENSVVHTYSTGSSSNFHSLSFIISAGYAFSN